MAVRRIGFRPLRFQLDLSGEGGDSAISVVVLMLRLPQMLQAVEVAAGPANYSPALDHAGFYRRLHERTFGAGGGHFIMPEEIERRNPSRLTHLMHGIPGVSVMALGGGARLSAASRANVVLGRGGRCVLGLLVDGHRLDFAGYTEEWTFRIGGTPPASRGSNMTLDEIVPIQHVKAIEVYPSPSQVPKEWAMHARNCGLIVVWTRRD